MGAYPLVLDLEGRLCVIVGGGRVAGRKLAGLLGRGARIRVVAPEITRSIAKNGEIELIRRAYQPSDLRGALLVFAATADRVLNLRIRDEAREQGALVNLATEGARGDFLLPALLGRGDLTLAVSTAGRSPALATLVRDLLAPRFGPEWGQVAEIAGRLREKLLTVRGGGPYYQRVLSNLLQADLPSLIASGDTRRIDLLLRELPEGARSLAELGIHLPNGSS